MPDDEDDQYDYCPVCGEEFTSQCKCLRSDRQCPNGHHWHRCPVHGFWVGGEGDHSSEACSCMTKHPWVTDNATAWDETGWFTETPIIAYLGDWAESKTNWLALLAIIAFLYWLFKR